MWSMVRVSVLVLLIQTVTGTSPVDYQVRLVAGPNCCSGRVEIYYNDIWGTVCDNGWDMKDAQVVCKQLDCGWAMEAPGVARYGQGVGSIWLNEVRCAGGESSLSQCRHAGIGKHNCGHSEDAGVRCSGKPQVIGSSQTLLAKVGDDVTFPCHIEPSVNVANMTVEWTRPDLKPAYVLVRQEGLEITDHLNPLYKGRTSLFPEQLPDGIISLKLLRVKLSDEGRFKCFVPTLASYSEIQLLVGAVSQPEISLVGPEYNGFSLTCDSGCWYPEPEVSWLDSEGILLPAEHSVTDRRSQHCYTVRRTVTVRQAGHVNCRVHLPHNSHTVETHHYIPEGDIPKEGGRKVAGAIAGIVITVIIIILVASAAIWRYFKRKQTKMNSSSHPEVSLEMNPLMKSSSHPEASSGDSAGGVTSTQQQDELREEDAVGVLTLPEEKEASRTNEKQKMTPIPRKWFPISERWRQQLEKLANLDDCNVTKVGSFVLGKGKEFHIATGSGGTEVFLGLREDGTEVAVKRMTKNSYEVLKNEERFLRLPELDDTSIVRYVDYVEDENFGYLGLQLCEYSLEEYINEHSLSELKRKQLSKQVLKGLKVLHCQNPQILHRDIKPQNVLIDIQNRARLADFGISRQLPKGHTSYHTSIAGTSCWKAKEALEELLAIKASTDIQVAGMLIYYILSGGYHPFGKGPRCETNILDGNYNLDEVQDVVAKDLIKLMINEDPKKRPSVEECLAHPFFWSNERKVKYLRRFENFSDDDKELIGELDQYAEQGQFITWKHKLPTELVHKMDEVKPYSENSFGLLRFIHDLHEHYAEDAADINLMEMFPRLFGCVYTFALEQDWNSRPTLKEMFQREDDDASAV